MVPLAISVLALKMFQLSFWNLGACWFLFFVVVTGLVFLKFFFCVVLICPPIHCPEGTVCHLFSLLQLQCLLYLELLFQLLISCCPKLTLFNRIFKLPHNPLSTYVSDLVSSSSYQPCSGLLFHPSWLRMAFLSLFCVTGFMTCNSFHFLGCWVPVLFLKCFFFGIFFFYFFSRLSSVPSMIQPWHNHFPHGFCLSHRFFTFPYLQKERLYHLPLKVPYKSISHVLQLGVGYR